MSPVRLGMDIKPKPVEMSPPPLPPMDERLSEVLDALRGLSSPTVVVEPPNLADIVTAVTSLKPGPTAAEIAAAIADLIQPPSVGEDGVAPLREVAEALRNLDFRMQGMGRQAYGGGAVHLEPGQSISIANQLIPSAYDEIVLSYTGSNVTGVVYKSAGHTTSTLTLTYSGDNITRVVRT